MLILGAHVAFTKNRQLLGCVEKTIKYGGNTFMFYTGSPVRTERFALDQKLTADAFHLMQEQGIDPCNVFVHAPYLINLANAKNFKFNVSFLTEEIKRCEQLGIYNLIIHPGNHVGLGVEVGIRNIIRALNEIIKPTQKVIIYLETMSGKGTECGSNFLELKQIIDGVKRRDKIKVCFDTCHLHDAGYDLNKFDELLETFDEVVGREQLGCIHLNDSQFERGAKKDRHANLGTGKIGLEVLTHIAWHPQLSKISKILETPYVNGEPLYQTEIEILKKNKLS